MQYQVLLSGHWLMGVLCRKRTAAWNPASEMKPVTKKAPSPEEVEDLVFANKIVKHSKSMQ